MSLTTGSLVKSLLKLTDLLGAGRGLRTDRENYRSPFSRVPRLPSSLLFDPDFSPSAALTEVARSAIERKDYDFAAKLLRTAISLSLDDAGATYDPFAIASQDATSIQFGEKQLAAMLAARPQISAFLNPTDDLYKWAVRAFARRINGGAIYWDSSPITGKNPSPAAHTPPHDGYPGYIRINPIAPESMGATQAFEQLWECESSNCTISKVPCAFMKLEDDASKDTISEEEYVKGIFVLEWRYAAQRDAGSM